jgi:hypothetical protein
VVVEPADPKVFGRIFHLITKDEDGKLRRRTYLFDTVRVHLTGTEEYWPEAHIPEATRPETKTNGRTGPWWSRTWEWLRGKTARKKGAG